VAPNAPRSPLRPLWLALACLSLGFGVVGLLVPGLPTTPFVILAAAAAARGSTRLHDWLVRHRVFGPLITDWRAHRAVRRRTKGVATATMALSAAVLFLVTPTAWLAGVASAVMAVVGAWLWLRPEPPPVPGAG
jgi:hypothetical protein